MSRTVALCCLIGLAACLGHPKTSPPVAPTVAAKPEPVVESEASGNRVVTGYNHAKHDLEAAKQAGTPEEASWQYLSARSTALGAQTFVNDAMQSGSWTKGLTYQTEADGKMDEAGLLDALDKLVNETETAWDAQKAPARKAWKRTYGVSSNEALDKLEELGKPTSTKKEKKNICWIFERDESKQTWCWTSKGKLAHKEIEPRTGASR